MSETLFNNLKAAIEANPDKAKKINGIFHFKLTGPDAEWVIDLKDAKVFKGSPSKSDVTLTMKDQDFQDLFTGKANGQQMFMSGKIKFKGNMGLLMKLSDLQKMA